MPPAMLVAHSYYLAYDAKQLRKMKPYPPLATLLVAARLRESGHDVTLFDAMLAEGVEDFRKVLGRRQPDITLLVEDNFNFLTKMCTLRMREAACEMIRDAKAAGSRVAVNGSDASDRFGSYLEAGADVVIVGEPDDTVLELVESWSDPGPASLDEIPGLVLPSRRGGGEVRRTPVRPYRRDLDALPLPAWDLVDVERYRAGWRKAHGRLSWSVVTSRGCPYKCNWCAKPIFGTRYAQRSPGDVAEELRQLRESVAPDHVWFADDIFGLTAKWIRAFAEEVTARDAHIPFLMQSRANLMKPEVVEALAAAGAEEVWIGAESGSQDILDSMDKGTTVEQLRTATRNLKGAGIRACWFIQLGYLGEDWDDIVKTRDLIREEWPDDIGVSVSYPLPGTPFYETVRAQLGSKRNWSHSDDLAMLFQGTYETGFYKKVRELLHDEVDAGPTASPAVRKQFDSRWNRLGASASSRAVGAVAET